MNIAAFAFAAKLFAYVLCVAITRPHYVGGDDDVFVDV